MLQEFLDLWECCSINVHASVVSHRGGGAWEDLMTLPAPILTGLPVKEGSTRLAKSTPRAVNARTGSTVSVPSGGKPSARPTKRAKAKDAPTEEFCLSSYQREYALESRRATLRRACIAHLFTTGPEISRKGVCIGHRIGMSGSVPFTREQFRAAQEDVS